MSGSSERVRTRLAVSSSGAASPSSASAVAGLDGAAAAGYRARPADWRRGLGRVAGLAAGAPLRLFLGLLGLLERLEQQAHVVPALSVATPRGRSAARPAPGSAGGRNRRPAGRRAGAVVAVEARLADHRGAQEDHQLGLDVELVALLEQLAQAGNGVTPGIVSSVSRALVLHQAAEHRDLAALQPQHRVELARLEDRDQVGRRVAARGLRDRWRCRRAARIVGRTLSTTVSASLICGSTLIMKPSAAPAAWW